MKDSENTNFTGSAGTIGIICADSSDIFMAKAIYYIERLLRARDYNSVLCCSGYELKNKENALHFLSRQKVDGIILIGSSYVYEQDSDNQYIRDAALSRPIMLLNAVLDNPNVYCIVADDYISMYEAVDYMVESGITDILYFYNSVSYSGRKKLAGYLAAMKLHELTPQREFYSGSNEDIPAMTAMLNQYDAAHSQDGNRPFHGIITADDALALAAVKYAMENGRAIPDDLSIIGYNNSFLVHCCEPELTSIDNQLETMCRKLVDILLDVLAHKEARPTTIISGDLITRGTTKQ